MSTTDSGASEVTDDARVRRRIRRAILPVAFLLYTFSYMDRSSISYAQLTMSKDLGIDIATYGTVAAIFFVAYVLLEVPSNIIMSRVGARLWLSRIAITWGLIAMATGFVNSATHLYIARIALGISEAGLFPGLVLYLTYWFRTQDRARALAAMVLAQPVALILGSITGGLILDHVDWFGLSSWRWVFILQGLPPIILGIWMLVYLADRPSKARWLSQEEGERVESVIAAEYQGDRDDHNDAHKKVDLRALKDPKILYLAFILLLGGMGTYGLAFFLPLVVAQVNPGYSATNIGFVGAIPYLCGAVALPLVARRSDRHGKRKGIVIALLSTAVVGLVLTVVFRQTSVIALVGLSMFAIGIIAYIPPFWAMACESLSRAQSAVGLALINSFASAGGFFGPYLIGKVASGTNVTIGLVVPAVALTLAVVLLFFVRPAKGSPAEVTHTV
jgi:MFS transporter, ACS family, tartrate transporter